MAIELDDVAEGVLAIHHPVGLLAGIIVSHLLHPLTAAERLDQLDASFQILVLETEVKQARPPVFERLLFRFGPWELEQFDADAVSGREMGNAEAAPTRPEDIVAHLADGAVVLTDLRRRHDLIESRCLFVELHGSVEIRHGDAHVGKGDGGHLVFLLSRLSPLTGNIFPAPELSRSPISARHMSSPTAITMIAPRTIFWVEVWTAFRFSPFCTIVTVSAPKRVAIMSPRPPLRLAPPITAAAIADSSRPTP